ncbi:structure-specific recognition protein-domain-containing protein [Mycena alexandri]|uniref:FACT complex subunit POB3 n=1 Tax=Mycena alexandri TaxID=1745969 RepID=A0AAD6WVA9_9AGAR|nr:structure-specific recognition protein-domain-containing protein [Mycena alexandri]KAJ7022404.1 structure-specific recognition protein-domain-containing protein [Mycena alexandri]
MAATQFDPIYRGLSSEVGKMRVASSGMAWKGVDSGDVTAVAAGDIKSAQWLRVARGFQLRIGLKDRKRETFDGFKREDLKKITDLLKNHFQITLEEIDVSFKGWNWGVTDFRGQDLAFLVSGKLGFELPLRNVGNSNIAGRTEVSLEFTPSTKTKHVGDEMTEIRFHVPGMISKAKGGSDDGSQKSDNEADDDEISAAQVFHDNIKETADIGQVTGDIILSFEEVLVLTPRGRYDVDMFPDFLRLRGKTYDYKIIYSTISKLFLLPKDDQHVLFILGLTTPIRQGQTRYHYLVMQFTREEEITAELNMDDEEVAKYDRLKKNYEDPTFEVVSSVFRALAKKKIIGSGSFQSRDGHPGIKANLKAVQGDLFMLEKYIFFVAKQPVLIELTDIHQVIFSRVGQGTSARTFDIKIITKTGPEYMFVSINKEEHEPTDTYLKEKKIRVKETVPDAEVALAAVGDEDEDDDMQSVDSDEDRKPRIKSARDDDEDSSEDEDFKASGSDSGSPSASDSDSDGAATASDASGDRDFTKAAKKDKKSKKAKDGEAPKKKKKKAAAPAQSDAEDDAGEKPKKKKAKAKADDAMDVDEEGGDKPKPKPKPKAKPKPKTDEDGGAMDVDDEAPRPKPKPKKKAEGASDEPPKKKLKKADD